MSRTPGSEPQGRNERVEVFREVIFPKWINTGKRGGGRKRGNESKREKEGVREEKRDQGERREGEAGRERENGRRGRREKKGGEERKKREKEEGGRGRELITHRTELCRGRTGNIDEDH